MTPPPVHRSASLFLLLAILLLSACAKTATGTPAPPTALPATPSPQATSLPTAAPARVVLVTSPGDDPGQTGAVQALLTSLAARDGLSYEERSAPQPGDITPDWKVVVLLTPPGNLSELLAAAPQTRFISASLTDLPAAPNLSVIRLHLEWQAFVAGYAATLIAADWRAAGLVPSDEPYGGVWVDAFQNGGRYLCGICNPYYAPLVRFPLVAYQPSTSDPSTWLAAADQLNTNIIYVMYVAPQAASPDLLNALALRNMIIMGSVTPPAEVRGYWAVTIGHDISTALEDLWQPVLAGQGGQVVHASIQLADISDSIFSPGRQQLVEQVISDLAGGFINPMSVPLE